MQLQDLDVLKEIPGYPAILKAVLKTQIQMLVSILKDCLPHLFHVFQK